MGYNIGMAATDTDQLVIMDKDNLEAVGSTKPTLTVTSRKRIGEHCFYFTDDKVASDIFEDSAKQNIATETFGEIRANWEYVVCAGSYVPVSQEEFELIPESDRANAGKYTVKEPKAVNKITYNELPKVYVECLIEKREAETAKKIKKEPKENYDAPNDKHKSALFNLTINDVTGENENRSHRFPSLFHGSTTGMNTSVSHGMLHCWRHGVSQSPLTALAILAGIGNCSSVGYTFHGRGSSSLDLKDGEIQFKLWEYAKINGIIPKEDPIPSKALIWYSLKNYLCDKFEVIDGWKFLNSR